jgi:hypothetical protein
MPLIAALPLIYFAMAMNARTSITLPFVAGRSIILIYAIIFCENQIPSHFSPIL